MHLRCAVVVLVAILGCGDDDDVPDVGTADAEEDAEEPAPFELEGPAAPALAELPDLRPCLPGWVEQALEGGAIVCAPFGGTRQTCEGSTAQFPSSATCERIGPACPSGDFPDDAPVGALYVLAGASGDGTRESPFGTIAAALDAAPVGGTVMIGKGEYPEALVVNQSVVLRGACAAETLLNAPEEQGAIEVESTPEGAPALELSVRALRVKTTYGIGIYANGGGHVSLDGVHLDTNGSIGAAASDLVATHVLVTGETGSGLFCDRCTIDSAVIVEANQGIFVLEDAHVTNVSVVTEFAGNADAVTLNTNARADVSGLATRRARGVTAGAGGRFTLDSASIENSRPVAAVSSGASGAVSRVWSRGDSGARFSAVSSELSVTRSVVQQSHVPLEYPDAIFSSVESTVILDHVLIDEASDIALVAVDGGIIRGHDVTLRGIHTSIAAPSGFGAFTVDGTIDLTRALFDRYDSGAFVAYGPSARGVLRDTIVRAGGDDDHVGSGISAEGGGQIELERVLVERARKVAVGTLGEGSSVRGTDVEIVDTRSDENDAFGRGLVAQAGSTIELERVRVSRCSDHAVVASTRGSVTLREARIVDAMARPCATTTCSDAPYGIGVASYRGTIVLDGFEVRRAALCALHVGEGGELDVRRGLIAESEIGVCVDREGFAIDAIDAEVRFEQNGANLDARRLPVPPPVPPIEIPTFAE